jgi:coenzyme F420-reducing hydrogenase alpha subunit
MRTITIDPVTRIEGHARVELDIEDDNSVSRAVFKVMDFRGFETFLSGMQVEMMPTITSRICGTCPQPHHLAAARTVDKVFGVQAPRAAELQRVALNMGSIIHSHGVHFFAMAGPDLLLGIDADPATRNIVGLMKSHPDVARKALRLRTLGALVTETIGGRPTHPVSFVPGGVSMPLDADKRAALRGFATEGLELGKELLAVAKGALDGQMELVEALPMETHYLGTVREDGALDLYQGLLRLRSPDGATDLDFSEDDWREHLFEEAVPTSYAKYVYCQTPEGPVPYRVGPLARLNVCDYIDTPGAQAELEAFRELAGHPCHQTVMFHHARLVELLHALEKLAEVVEDDEISSDNVKARIDGPPQSASAHVEAQRGTLIHDYEVDSEGIVTKANMIIATQQNASAIDATIAQCAERYIDQPDEVLLNGIEFGIRCYDPCLSCATHRVGEMKLEVVLRRDGEVFREARR